MKIFIPVYDKLPTKDDFYYFKIRNEGNLINCHFNLEWNEVHDADIIFPRNDIEYWLKEVDISDNIFKMICDGK